MEKVLIIGASGLLGGRMMELYAQRYEVHGTFNKHNSAPKNMHALDATRREEVAALMEKIEPDLVVDTHGLTNVAYCEANKEEALKINMEGTRNLAESVKAIGGKYVFISSDAVFDGEKATPYVEEDKPNPLNYYGMTKLMSERIVESLGIDYIIARTSTLFGTGAAWKAPSFTSWAISELRNKRPMQITSDQYCNPTYTDSLAQFVIRLHEKGSNGVFHAAGKETISRFDFAKRIAEVFDLDGNLVSPITTAELKQSVKKPLRAGLDISKAERAASMRGMTVSESLKAFKDAMSGAENI